MMPMEQLFKQYDKDCLKMAMLNHEETFRQQVHELHRLYRIQKLLMRDLKKELKSQRNLATSPYDSTDYKRSTMDMCSYEQGYSTYNQVRPRTALNLDVPAIEYIQSAEEDAVETDEETELELTLAIGSTGKKRDTDSGESFSSSSTESDVLIGQEWGVHEVTDRSMSASYRKRRPFDAVQGMRVEDGVQQPPLLFHWLSLRMA